LDTSLAVENGMHRATRQQKKVTAFFSKNMVTFGPDAFLLKVATIYFWAVFLSDLMTSFHEAIFRKSSDRPSLKLLLMS
jgi:hypothetical protein